MSRHHYGARLHRFTDDLGYRRVALENEQIRVEILLDKGASIRSFLHKPTDTEFMWHSPLGLRPAIETIGGDFLDGYEGGWQEIFPNGGPPSMHPSGVELPFHGEAATVPWDLQIELDEPSAVRVRLSIETARTALRLSKTLTLRAGIGNPRDRRTDVEPVAVPGRADVGQPPGIRGPVPRCVVSRRRPGPSGKHSAVVADARQPARVRSRLRLADGACGRAVALWTCARSRLPTLAPPNGCASPSSRMAGTR